jgi:hypothetical protein
MDQKAYKGWGCSESEEWIDGFYATKEDAIEVGKDQYEGEGFYVMECWVMKITGHFADQLTLSLALNTSVADNFQTRLLDAMTEGNEEAIWDGGADCIDRHAKTVPASSYDDIKTTLAEIASRYVDVEAEDVRADKSEYEFADECTAAMNAWLDGHGFTYCGNSYETQNTEFIEPELSAAKPTHFDDT